MMMCINCRFPGSQWLSICMHGDHVQVVQVGWHWWWFGLAADASRSAIAGALIVGTGMAPVNFVLGLVKGRA